MNQAEILEINTRIATELMGEEKPNWFPPEDESFANWIDGHPTLSEKKNWYIRHTYDEGDNQIWMPVNFWEDARETERLIYRMIDQRSFYFQMNSLGRTFRACFIPLSLNTEHQESVWHTNVDFTKAICTAALDTVTQK